jgi:hypothetical protein
MVLAGARQGRLMLTCSSEYQSKRFSYRGGRANVIQTWKESDPNAAFIALQSANLNTESFQRLARQLES